MQLATKPITTAIKLATLQQNGRRNQRRYRRRLYLLWRNVHDACDDVVFTNIFLKICTVCWTAHKVYSVMYER